MSTAQIGVVLLTLTLLPVAEAQSLPDNPLALCPDTPNCERVAKGYEVPPDTLYGAAERALESLGPVTLRQPSGSASRRLEAVYRVALVFKDDVDVVVRAREHGGSALYVRSASRVGHSDLGVNRRRVDRFLEAVGAALRKETSPE
ncbi:DUF1499 domain-containing protein [Salinibacter altiplanensis]|uniref:DUF1499 domain-containing protein n=1 Tax=Salinibacter altiplanensis TaxID=1803181 RepID=UPI000C9F9E92|nr:DUF1499 domain-containing protein [Salinibacter altiplanensis]